MKARLSDLALTFTGKQRLTLELDEDFRKEYDQLKDMPVDITIKKHRKRRSLDANAYFWVLCGKLSEKLRIPPKEIYRQYIPDVGGNFEIVPVKEERLEAWARIWANGHDGRVIEDMGQCRNTPGYHNVRCYIGSSEYDTAQMSRLIDLAVADCKEQGIETTTPAELARLEGYEAEYFTGRS